MKPAHVWIGAALVAAGALAAIWVPAGLLGAIALLALLRICWLEDNIASDLIGRDTPPNGYRNTARGRRLFLFRWFGIVVPESGLEHSAGLMATAMRAEAQIWSTLLLGMAGALVAQHGVFGIAANLMLGCAVFGRALIAADRLAVSLMHCDAGQALPERLLVPVLRGLLSGQGKP